MARDRQPGLFDALDGPPRYRDVGPAKVDEALRKVAEALPETVRLGTSSWSFPGWNGIVYDREATTSRLARHGLPAYAAHPLFRTVGIDRTYYAPIEAREFADYAADVPDDFSFLVKACGECTTPWQRASSGRGVKDNPFFLDPEWAAAQVVRPFVEGLGAKAGPLVFQFPPLGSAWADEPERFHRRLSEFLTGLPQGPLYAVELRNGSLFDETYRGILRESGTSHCFNVHPSMPDVASQLETMEDAGPLVIRWMLHGTRVYEEARRAYAPFDRLVDEDPSCRQTLAEAVQRRAESGNRVWLIANNKAEGSAPLTLARLAEQMAPRG